MLKLILLLSNVKLFSGYGPYGAPDADTCVDPVGRTLSNTSACCAELSTAELQELQSVAAPGGYTTTDCDGEDMWHFPNVTACCKSSEPDEIEAVIATRGSSSSSSTESSCLMPVLSGQIVEIDAPPDAGWAGGQSSECVCGSSCGCENSVNASAWPEKKGVYLWQDTPVSVLTSEHSLPETFSNGIATGQNAWASYLPAGGGPYASYFVHSDKNGQPDVEIDWSATFSSDIVAIIFRNSGARPGDNWAGDELQATDAVFGATGTSYWDSGDNTRGVTIKNSPYRGFTISADKRTLTMDNMIIRHAMQDMRIILDDCSALVE